MVLPALIFSPIGLTPQKTFDAVSSGWVDLTSSSMFREECCKYLFLPREIQTQQKYCMDWRSLLAEGKNSAKEKRFDLAIDLFSKAIKKMPEISIYEARSLAYEQIGDLESALTDSNTILELSDQCSRGYLRKARVLCLKVPLCQ